MNDELNTYNETDVTVTADLAEKLHVEHLISLAVQDGRKLATVRTIDAINDIPGADLIKVATVEGWKVVVKAGEFKVGDLCLFLEVDTFLPLSDTRFAFLEKNAITWQGLKGARLKTIRLRKQLSQGLALPITEFPELLQHVEEVLGTKLVTSLNYPEVRALNFTGVLRLMKWEKVMSAQLAGQAKGNFPSFLQKSDQERCQNMGRDIFGYEDESFEFDTAGIPIEALDVMCDKGEVVWHDAIGKLHKVRKATASRDTRYEVTLKLDGSSMTAYVRNLEDGIQVKGVCSRNLDLKIEGNEDNAFVKMASPDILELIALQGGDTALQGELMGPGIQGNREGFAHDRFFVYNVYDIKKGQFMLPEERTAYISKANKIAEAMFGHPLLEHVPVLAHNVTLEELGITDMDSLLSYAVGKSMVNPVREGVVFKAMDGRHQFKAISNLFLEQEK